MIIQQKDVPVLTSWRKDERLAYILHADEAGASQQAGGKAGGLATLAHAHLPIPPWFVIAPVVFTASLSDGQRATFAAACATADLTTIEAVLSEMRLDERMGAELARELAALCPRGERVAVRSSAFDEDGAARSFAGQLETFLFVAPEQVAERIIDVWRSGFSERVLAYRREHGLSLPTEPPAVLVQRMVEADVAGVAFSADPVSGRRGVAVVSALYGLGTALVSGECDADTYTLDRDGVILTRTLAEKSAAHRHICGNVVETVPVPTELVKQPALTDAQIRAVAELARRCERHFGCPQDIEWASADGKLFLLQTRPITSLAGMADPDGRYALWDNSNIAESYNGITTPLTFSFARYAYEQVYRQMCRVLGVPEATIARYAGTFRCMIGLVNGRVYYNLLSWYRLLALMPGFTANRTFMEQMMGVKEGLPETLVTELGQSTWRGRLLDRLRLLLVVCKLLTGYGRLPREIRRFFQRINQALAPRASDLAQLRADELMDAYRALERQLLAHWDAPLVNDLFAMLFYGMLRALVLKWCGDASGSFQNDLLTGEGGIISAEPARRVRAMAALAAPHPALIEILCNGSRGEILSSLAGVPALAEAYQSYLNLFADRCLEELKLESATLRDDPLPLLRSIGHLARRLQTNVPSLVTLSTPRESTINFQPGERTAEPLAGAERRQQAEQRVATILRGHPMRRLLFGWVLKQARARVRDRENLRFERTRVFGCVRRIFSELGQRLHALDLLEEPRDIFYLEVEEVLGFVNGTATTTDLKGLVSVRKAEYARFQALPVPADRFETHGIVSVGHTFTESTGRAEKNLPADGELHQGTGCCPGLVRGPVRVITDPRGAEIRAGEILVAERTDPGWIMLFPAAAGVLVERGSLLSHSAIVAREMSIPTIVGLHEITRWLHTGEWVELDGSSGVVRKLPTPPSTIE